MPAGTIISQNPQPGELAAEGSKIDVVVSTEGAKRVRISVRLPDVNRNIVIRAWIDGKPVAEETLNPSEVEGGRWRPVITGEEGRTVLVKVYIDKVLYQDISVDIDAEEQTIERDRSDAAEFR